MDFFDMSKKFERVYVEPGETDGAIFGSSKELKLHMEREKKGTKYADKYQRDELLRKEDSSPKSKIPDALKATIDDLECTTAGTPVNVGELEMDKISNIYKQHYENKPKPNCDLIINDYKKKILSLVETNEVTILTGPTGCGKTTQVPQFVLDSNMEKNKYCNIVVTQPRRIAAISVAKRVAKERDWELGKLCGYKVGLKNCTSGDTLLTYMTVGVLLQTLINKKCMNQYTHIILDEIHERDQSMDFALIVIKKLLSNPSNNVKIILMSATVEAMKFANYFQKLHLGELLYAPILKINHSTNYAVQIHYLEELSPLGNLPEISAADPHISDLNFDLCIRLIKQFEKIDNEVDNKNSVLVFLPGIYEIEYLYMKLTDPRIHSTGVVKYKWCPLPLHSSVTIEEQAQAFLPAPTGYRKIILSTNIAESSVTVPGVKFVIDFCLTKCVLSDASNFSSLRMCWASKANCIQRAGRVGRVMEGRVYRMVYRHFYETLEKETVPEMLTAPLEKVVLQSKMLDMGEPRAILGLALDPPDLSNIEWTILMLKEVGGLLPTRKGVATPYDGDLTFLGRLMALMPVDIHITRLIVLGHLFSCLEECIIMGSCMSLKSVFSHPFKARIKAYNSKLDWADGSYSDCIAFLNVYQIWCNNHKNGYFKRSAGDNEARWAKRHFVQLRVLKEVKLLIEEITQRLKENLIEESMGIGKVRWNSFQKALVLKISIAGAFYPNYFKRSHVTEETAVKVLGGRNPFTTVYFTNFPSEQPAELYSQLFKNELAECNEEMRISSDRSSKVYVEFRKQTLKPTENDLPFDGTLPGKIPMGVYRALKIRSIHKNINIKLLPIKEAKERALALGIKSRLDLFISGYEDNNSIVPISTPGLDISCLQVTLGHVIDPGHFWVYDAANAICHKKIFDALNRSSEKPKKLEKLPAVGDICVAPLEDSGEMCLYRARVESVKAQSKKIQVFFVDYGNSAIVDFNVLREYNPEKIGLPRVPAQALECVLSEIRPSMMKNARGDWSDKARIVFDNMTKEEALIAKIYSVVNGVLSIELFKVDEKDNQISINDYLINLGLAEKAQENYLSRLDNEMRKQKQLYSNDKKSEDPRWVQNTSDSYVEPPDPKDCTVNVSMRGPFSPLEMRLYAYPRNAIEKTIRISEESVNSVLLDPDPDDPHERLVVAGYINQNPEGGLLTLNNTTIMPNIHGLTAIIPFIFAPEIELRVNDDKTRYTGMLCGLGADEDGEPIFPEHDFEIVFDSEITFEDFTNVNSLRYLMSLMLLTEEDETYPNLSFPDVIRLQRKIRNHLVSLLTRKRKSVEPLPSREDYKWKLIPSDLIIYNPIAKKHNRNAIFRFHPGISVTPQK